MMLPAGTYVKCIHLYYLYNNKILVKDVGGPGRFLCLDGVMYSHI